MFKGKKADASEGIILLISIFFIAVAFIAVLFINSKFHYIITQTSLNQSSVASNIGSSLEYINTYGVQNGFMILFVFLIIGMMLSAYLVRVHPIWAFVYVITTGFAVFFGAILANTYSAIINNPHLYDIASQQVKINWIMKNIVKIILGAVGLSLIILFSKPNEGVQV